MQRGEWITDTIQLSAPIAEGAMGRVWVGYHHRLQIQVAIKFVSEKLGDDTAEAVARFEREASTASQIRSLHVVQTFDSGVTRQGAPYIVMELLEGESLGDRLRRAGRLELREAVVVIAHAARALQKAHDLGIVHRDIKPDNIFICGSEDGPLCKILDFGIAKQTQLPAMGGLTTDGKIVGTPEYMSPEQVLEDRPVDARADLWALAVVMYQAMTGELPFTGATLGQLCLNLVGRKPLHVTHYRPDLPQRVDAWFARALSRDPQHRFGSAREMAQAFTALEEDLLFAVERDDTTDRHLSSTSTLKRLPTPGRFSGKASVVLTAGAVAAVIAVLGGGSWMIARPSEAPVVAQSSLVANISGAVRTEELPEASSAPPSVAPTANPISGPEPSTTASATPGTGSGAPKGRGLPDAPHSAAPPHAAEAPPPGPQPPGQQPDPGKRSPTNLGF